jgi:hypothetical protein
MNNVIQDIATGTAQSLNNDEVLLAANNNCVSRDALVALEAATDRMNRLAEIADCSERDNRHEKTSNRMFALMKFMTVILVTWLCTVQYNWVKGSVLHGYKSGAGMESKIQDMESDALGMELENFALNSDNVAIEHVWKIVDDQKIQILHLMQKMHFKEETNKIFLGFLTNEIRYLNHALVINPDRPNGFPFTEWNPALIEPLLQFAFDAFHYETLFWVSEQPGWESVVDKEFAEKLKTFLIEYATEQ